MSDFSRISLSLPIKTLCSLLRWCRRSPWGSSHWFQWCSGMFQYISVSAYSPSDRIDSSGSRSLYLPSLSSSPSPFPCLITYFYLFFNHFKLFSFVNFNSLSSQSNIQTSLPPLRVVLSLHFLTHFFLIF